MGAGHMFAPAAKIERAPKLKGFVPVTTPAIAVSTDVAAATPVMNGLKTTGVAAHSRTTHAAAVFATKSRSSAASASGVVNSMVVVEQVVVAIAIELPCLE